MVRWLPWTRGPNYEYELPRLASKIRELRLKELAATNANLRWPTAFIQHSLSIYLLYLIYALLFASNKRYHRTIAVIVPFVLVAGYIGIARVTRWRRNRLQARLKLVVAKRETLVAAYKKQVHFDKVMNLIGDENLLKDPLKEGVNSGKSAKGKDRSTKNKDKFKGKDGSAQNNAVKTSGNSAAGHSSLDQPPIPVYQTSWVDRVLDVLIGVNENSPAYRYALICPHCHAHNGLAPYGHAAEEITYVCRVCGTLVKGKQDPDFETKSVSPKSGSPESPTVESPVEPTVESTIESTHSESTPVESPTESTPSESTVAESTPLESTLAESTQSTEEEPTNVEPRSDSSQPEKVASPEGADLFSNRDSSQEEKKNNVRKRNI